ncbi:N-formylglutamate amidohydrolase [soil metagenome]
MAETDADNGIGVSNGTTQKRNDLLGPDDPPPVGVLNPAGRSAFLLLGDHAGIAIPAALGTLGLSAQDRARHIACDIGVQGLGQALAPLLDATFIHQVYSRLVVDCNRDPLADDAIPAVSDGARILGNESIGPVEKAQRVAQIHAPYQQAIAAEIAHRRVLDQPIVLVSLHSFTPVMAGRARPWHVGILHGGGDEAFSHAVLQELSALDRFVVGDNQPYHMDATDHTVPRHAFGAGLAYVELEIRQDLIGNVEGQHDWAHILAKALVAARDN